MSSNDNITLDPQEAFLTGIAKVSAVIRQSYGPKGSNVSIETNLYPTHFIANDAQSIIQAIHLDDPIERRGLNFLKELSDKASKSSGEGRKTTIIIAEEILKGGFKEGVNGIKFKEELDALLPTVLDSIDKQSKRVELEDIHKIAQTSSRSAETADWIQKIYNEIGRDGIISVEGSGMSETMYEVTDGVKFNSGAITSYMSGEYNDPVILITKRKIEKDLDIDSLVNKCAKEGKALIIVTDDMDSNVASRLVATRRAGVCKICIIKVSALWKNFVYEDFAKCTGATVVEEATGLTFKNLPLDALGTCDKLIVDQEETILRGIKDIASHKDQLREKGDNDSLLRLQWLNTKTALLKLGAGSESELSYKRLKAQDAISACRLALQDGIVEGGAKSLVLVSNDVMKSNILENALMAPYKQLKENNGGQELETEEVYDSTLVIKNAVKNAISLAGIVLTTGADIRIPERSFEDKQLELLYKKQNPF